MNWAKVASVCAKVTKAARLAVAPKTNDNATTSATKIAVGRMVFVVLYPDSMVKALVSVCRKVHVLPCRYKVRLIENYAFSTANRTSAIRLSALKFSNRLPLRKKVGVWRIAKASTSAAS